MLKKCFKKTLFEKGLRYMLGTEGGKTRVLQTWNANSFSNIA